MLTQFNKLLNKFVQRKANIELNLLSLQIKDKEVMADFSKEKILKQNAVIFWFNMAGHLVNIAFTYYDFLNGGAAGLF